ncbi:MAG TPA: rhodanese-like domain-containing protein [Ilumatobacteraceae bacterium]|nr:rhodanese-like domain-containing protein [Ilumatobacteraceae bacterium]
MSDRRAKDSLLDAFAEVGMVRSSPRVICSRQLAARIAAGDVVVIDVRPTAEFAAGHIAGARSVPIDDHAANIVELPAAS